MNRPARGALAARAPPPLLPPLLGPSSPLLFLLLSPWEAPGREGGSARGEQRGRSRGGGAARLVWTPGTGLGRRRRRPRPRRPRAHPLSQAGSALIIPGGSQAPFPGQGLGSLGLQARDCGSGSGTAGPRAGPADLRTLALPQRRFASNGPLQPPRSPPSPGVKPIPGRRGLRGGAAAAVEAGLAGPDTASRAICSRP